jgi:hypothetical protein
MTIRHQGKLISELLILEINLNLNNALLPKTMIL